MTLEYILMETNFIKDDTKITIRDSDFNTIAYGNWYQDDILEYINHEIELFTWQNDNEIFIDLL